VRATTEVFKTGIGAPDEMNALFAAMASAVGLDARPVMVADRTDIGFDQSLADEYFLRSIDMAVRIGQE